MTTKIGQWTLALDGTDIPDLAVVGGKAWSIARMRATGLPVPAAFTISTHACNAYLKDGTLPASLYEEIRAGIDWLNQQSGRNFNGEREPLLVSVRSGAPISMPGMMDTVLNLGITDQTEAALAAESGSESFARDTHRRFLELFANIVLKATVPELDPTADPTVWREQITNASGQALVVDPYEQLSNAVEAVFASWNSRRAKRYRKHNGIADDLGTAVTVQAMVFGNLDDRSGTGVVFSRNPLNGDKTPFGEYLHKAQGEDVVSGKFTPEALDAMKRSVPAAYDQLLIAVQKLEDENKDVQDIEFTVQRGELFLLQTRAAKRAPEAAVCFAVDMVADGQIDIETALSRVSAEQVRTLLAPRLTDTAIDAMQALATGEPACQGVGIGKVVASSDEAENLASKGQAVILARPTTSPEDVHGMIAAQAIITEQGGATSHAAVVSRALGRPCIVGCGDGSIEKLMGQEVTVDGQSGNVYSGRLPIELPDENKNPQFATLLSWLLERSPVTVLTVAEDCAEEVTDLDGLEGSEDPEKLPGLLAGKLAVSGGAVESDAGVAAAVDAGVKTIIAKQRLPVLLAAWHHRRNA